MKLFNLISGYIILTLLMRDETAFGQSQQDSRPGYLAVQYVVSRAQAEQILEDTRSRLFDMIQRRGGNPQTILLTGDMVRNWKSAQQAFDNGDYSESVRICNIIQKYLF
jgi:hypothetical protein